jgi:ankyrin repeat protein
MDGWRCTGRPGGGHETVVRLLLEKGADVKAKTSSGWTALHLAARGGHEAVVRLLLEKGADAKAKTSSGWTALHLAARVGHEVVVRLLEAVI